MDQVLWIILFPQQGSQIGPPTSELLITENSISLETEAGEDLITEGT